MCFSRQPTRTRFFELQRQARVRPLLSIGVPLSPPEHTAVFRRGKCAGSREARLGGEEGESSMCGGAQGGGLPTGYVPPVQAGR